MSEKTMCLDIVDELEALSLSDPKQLLFRPTGDRALLLEDSDDIPRYLFRVFTPKSRGVTDSCWTKSMDATLTSGMSKIDIFAREDDEQVASMLNSHLRWEESPEDNFVSWTSSLLFALVYVFHLHANIRNRSAFEDIKVCIIDTTKFRRETFLRDMNLIEAYFSFNVHLKRFHGMRSRPDFYVGESLSQGALDIAGKCEIVSAHAIIKGGLYDLRPEFEEFAQWRPQERPPSAYPVLELRKDLNQTGSPESIGKKLQTAVDVARLFGSCWTLPVAANLLALMPGSDGDVATASEYLSKCFNGQFLLGVVALLTFADYDKGECSLSRTRVMAHEKLPEVERFGKIMQNVHRDFCASKLYVNAPIFVIRCWPLVMADLS